MLILILMLKLKNSQQTQATPTHTNQRILKPSSRKITVILSNPESSPIGREHHDAVEVGG